MQHIPNEGAAATTSRIQAEIDRLAPGAVVYIWAGPIELSKPLRLKKGVSLSGSVADPTF